MSTARLGNKRIPIGGGGYLRLYPHQITEKFVERSNAAGNPVVVYLHPWELDDKQKFHYLGLKKSFQHYVNLSTTHWKLDRLLHRFPFTSIQNGLEAPRIQRMVREKPLRVADLYGDPQTAALNSAYLRRMAMLEKPAPAEVSLEEIVSEPF